MTPLRCASPNPPTRRAVLSQIASAQTPNPSSATSSASQSATSAGNAAAGKDSPPVIQINGDNPATIQVGTTYNDLGATITGPLPTSTSASKHS